MLDRLHGAATPVRRIRRPTRQLYPTLHQLADAGLPMLVIENALGKTVVALQGAHVMSFQPAGQPEMLWISPKTLLLDGTPIRGGIPLCLPWFGPGLDGKTMHGFARIKEWTVVVAERLRKRRYPRGHATGGRCKHQRLATSPCSASKSRLAQP